MNRGSSLVEVLGAMSFGLVALTLVFQIARSSWTSMWMDQVLYEALICAAEQNPLPLCRHKTHVKAGQIPLTPRVTRLHLWRQGRSWWGEIKWQAPLQIQGHFKQELRLDDRALR